MFTIMSRGDMNEPRVTNSGERARLTAVAGFTASLADLAIKLDAVKGKEKNRDCSDESTCHPGGELRRWWNG